MITHYIKSFLNSIQKNRFFYTINLTGFMAGFLLLTIIFTYVYQELSFDRFHKSGSTICRIHSGGYGVTPLCFGEQLRNKVPEISGIVRFCYKDLTIVSENGEVKVGKTHYVDPEIFQVFSFKLLSGDVATVLEAPFSIVINQSTAKKIYGQRSPIGETFRDKEGAEYTITGIMEDIPYNSHIQSGAFISIETLRKTGDQETFNCGSWDKLTYIRLADNANLIEVEAKINAVLENSRMETSEGKTPVRLEPLKKIYFDRDNNKFDSSKHGNQQTVVLYLAVSILILLIVITNYINLSTAISGSRMREIAIHKVNGAKQAQIVKRMMMESLGVTFFSFMFALLIIELLLPRLSTLLNIPVSPLLNRSNLYLYYFAGIFLIGLITGLIPGIFLSRTNEMKALKNEFVFNSRGIQRKVLLVFQLVIVAILLNCTFIMKKQIHYVLNKDLGFNYENVISFDLDKTLQDKSELLKTNLLKNPAIESVSYSSVLIGDGYSKAAMGFDDDMKFCYFFIIDANYLNLYQMEMKYGRNFSPDLKTDAISCCIVNEAFCKIFGIENPVGKSMKGNREIIGVVKDFNFTSLHNKVEPLILMNDVSGYFIQIKLSSINQEETIGFIMNTCKSLSPEFECKPLSLDNHMKQLYKSEIDLKNSFEVYSIITFVIALLGLFGLTLFMAKKKTKEISIRLLYGSRLTDTFKLFAKEQIWIVLIANSIAIPISLFVIDKWLANFQYKADFGLFVFIETLFVTTLFTVLTMLVIIIRTHRTNLIETLKYE